MTDLLIPGLVAAAAITFTYLFCIRPMRRGDHCGMPGMRQGGSCCGGSESENEAIEIERLRTEIAELRASDSSQQANESAQPRG